MIAQITRDVEHYEHYTLSLSIGCFGLGVIVGLLAGIWLWGG